MDRCDVVVVGTGLAGLSAALAACQAGRQVAVLSKGNPLRSNSAMASGGINAVLSHTLEDSPRQHALDTLKGADGLGDEKAAMRLCSKAAESIRWLDQMGVGFDQDEWGRIAQRRFGGTGKSRTCYVADRTGAALTQALMRTCQEAGITFLTQRFLLSLIHKRGRITGLSLLNQKTGQVEAITAQRVVLAGGGFAGIYAGHTTNPLSTTGDALVAALKAGLSLSNLEFVQFHPTTLAGSGELVSEAVRGEGGHLVDENGERFTDELQTRDRLARTIAKRLAAGGEVAIDVRHLDPALIAARLPAFMRAASVKKGIDVTREVVPIAPAAHYTMGGIVVNRQGQSAIKGLFACGECADSGVHGANRLGGNSLLEAAAFGQMVGGEAAKGRFKTPEAITPEALAADRALVAYHLEGENRFNTGAIRKSLGRMLMQKAGIFRDESGLLDALEYIEYLQGLTGGLHCIDKNPEGNVELAAILELKNALTIAEAMVLSAQTRRESRGSHTRLDYPNRRQ
jgi:succinate dehydrogenase/fumarate reductase flavoprotein subunit